MAESMTYSRYQQLKPEDFKRLEFITKRLPVWWLCWKTGRAEKEEAR